MTNKLQVRDSGFQRFKRKAYITSDAHQYNIIAEIYGESDEDAKANAEHIVKCVNLHEELIQKLDDWAFEIQATLEDGDLSQANYHSLTKIQSEIKELQKK